MRVGSFAMSEPFDVSSAAAMPVCGTSLRITSARYSPSLKSTCGAVPENPYRYVTRDPRGAFFTFTTTPGQDLLRLDISVDQAHEAVLDALAAQTAAAREQR